MVFLDGRWDGGEEDEKEFGSASFTIRWGIFYQHQQSTESQTYFNYECKMFRHSIHKYTNSTFMLFIKSF